LAGDPISPITQSCQHAWITPSHKNFHAFDIIYDVTALSPVR
jgi:hypothetical protein